VLALDQRGIALSSGSACHAGAPEPSASLLAMGLTDEEAHCSIRLSLGWENSRDEVDGFLSAAADILKNGEATVRFVSCR
jgi:cysteine sulfinate desulfinase/cysteine desulfurase-like protein